jgi:WD40 repeat protein
LNAYILYKYICISERHKSKIGGEYATVGDDGVLKVWSTEQKCCIRRTNIENASRALSYSLDGLYIVVGLGGDPLDTKKDGAFVVINSRTMDLVTEDRRAKKCITDIKFHKGRFFAGKFPLNF